MNKIIKKSRFGWYAIWEKEGMYWSMVEIPATKTIRIQKSDSKTSNRNAIIVEELHYSENNDVKKMLEQY